MKARELAEALMKNPDAEVTCSVDVSDAEDPHADGRVFGSEILDVIVPNPKALGGEITICFDLESVNQSGFESIARRAKDES